MSDGDLLKPFREAGTWHSKGQFTLDPAKALEKLQSHSLSDPRRYILSLVSWAIGAGASEVEVQTVTRGLEFRPKGVSLSAASLEAMLALSNPLATELAIASVSACQLARSQGVTMEGDGVRLQMGARQLSLEPGESGAPTLWSRQTSGSWRDLLSRGESSPELEVLREGCRHAEVPIFIDGFAINQAAPLPRIRAALVLDGAPPLPVAAEALTGPAVATLRSPGNFSALVVASTTPILQTSSLYVVRGVSFARPPVQVHGENFAVVVVAPELSKDLSGAGLVENEECRRIQDEVAKLANELWTWTI